MRPDPSSTPPSSTKTDDRTHDGTWILEQVRQRLAARVGSATPTVETITVGQAAILVELEGVPEPEPAPEPAPIPERDSTSTSRTGRTNAAGLAHRPRGPAAAVGTPELETLLEWAVTAPPAVTDETGPETALRKAAGIAALNALSAQFMQWERGDPMELLPSSVETIATVGLFRPAFRKFGDVTVNIVEREGIEPASPIPKTASLFTPAEAETAFADADIVFLTGSTLVYGGIDRYLSLLTPTQTAVLIGATASFLPEPAFDAGVDVLAGAHISDLPRARAAVGAGACGTELHDSGVEKRFVATRNGSEAGGTAAETSTDNHPHTHHP